jgi:hypothetical protein
LPVSTAACLYTFIPGLSTTRLYIGFLQSCILVLPVFVLGMPACYWACLPVTGHACLCTGLALCVFDLPACVLCMPAEYWACLPAYVLGMSAGYWACLPVYWACPLCI